MIIVTARGRDAMNVRPHDTRRYKLPMQLQFSTSPLFGDPRLPTRFWLKVRIQENGCWKWMGGRSTNGYGQFSVNLRHVQAHRWAYEQLVGPFPPGLESDHLCRNRACVNTAHLEPVTHVENLRRGSGGKGIGWWHRAKTQCLRGHPFNKANTYFRLTGGRACRPCQRMHTAAWRVRNS